jgi:hypothetical protein
MDKVALYNTKLLSIKATMSMLTGRSKQLQIKADKLKQIKIQYLSQIDKIRKMEQEKDQAIAAKHSITITSNPSSPQIPTPSSTTSSPLTPLNTSSNDALPTLDVTAAEPASIAVSSSTSTPKIKSIVKKKKKSKAREALIGDDDNSTGNWVPKRSISQKDLLIKKP